MKIAAVCFVLLSLVMGCASAATDDLTESDTAPLVVKAPHGDGTPTPLDHPIPVIDFPQSSILFPAPRELDGFFGEWERNPRGIGCVFTFAVLWDPVRGEKVSVPMTVCH